MPIFIDFNPKIRKKELNNKIDIKDLNENAIKNSIHNIFHISKGELPGDPSFGSQLNDYLFSNMYSKIKSTIEFELKVLLSNFESRITTEKVNIILNEEYGELIIEVQYTITGDVTKEVFSSRVSFDLTQYNPL